MKMAFSGEYLKDTDITPDILTALKNGDYNAYDKVYVRYSTPLYNFLCSLIRSDEDAKEIVQDIFLSLWEKKEKINPQKNITSYLYNAARFAAMNYFDHKKVKDKYRNYSEGVWDEALSVDQIMIGKETALLIELALNRMPKQRRLVFEMSRVDNMTYEQIAQELNLSRKTVENHISNALKDIKEVILMFVLLLLP